MLNVNLSKSNVSEILATSVDDAANEGRRAGQAVFSMRPWDKSPAAKPFPSGSSSTPFLVIFKQQAMDPSIVPRETAGR